MINFDLIGYSVEVALQNARDFLRDEVKDGGRITQVGQSFGDLKQDTEIRADQALGQFFLRTFMLLQDVRSITIEGFKSVGVDPKGTLTIFIDPLDGSLCYRQRCNTLGLPYTGVVTVFEQRAGVNPAFQSIVAAGIIDYRSGDLWLATRQSSGKFLTTVNGQRVFTDQRTKLDIGGQILMINIHYPLNRALALNIFAEKGWLTNCKSAAYEMATVANGMSIAFICGSQKHHELGAGYALVRGAGGVVVNFDGMAYDRLPFDFNSQSAVILAANQVIAEELLRRLLS